MYEELYIIDKGVRLRVDLETPSGITLNFKSNIFGDLSKITCSYSYTFKLPLTANNRRVFDNADDIRTYSNKIRKRLKAVYIQNGIPLFDNANLYIDSTETCFNAVMTWGVIDGFQTLKDDDISIRELWQGKSTPLTVDFGYTRPNITEFDNTQNVLKPAYNAGLKYIDDDGLFHAEDCYCVYPLPVVPINSLIKIINEKFGTKFKFDCDFKYVDGWGEPRSVVMQRGVIPLVKADVSSDSVGTFYMTIMKEESPYGIGHMLKGTTNGHTYNDADFGVSLDSNGLVNAINIKGGGEIEIDGYMFCSFTYHDPKTWPYTRLPLNDGAAGIDYKPKLTIYKRSGNTNTAIRTIEGKYHLAQFSSDGTVVTRPASWLFNFSKEWGASRVTTEVNSGDLIFFAFSSDKINFQVDAWHQGNATRIYKSTTLPIPDRLMMPSDHYSEYNKVKIDVMSNLPDISCMTLLKAIYYMIGAFPTLNSSGEVVPLYFIDLKNNVVSQNVADWSDRLIGDSSSLPTKISYEISGFGQNNYYLLKNDDLESKDTEEDADVYEHGFGNIPVNNETIEKNKTIIQVPFYGKYIQDGKYPRNKVGILKFWQLDDEGKFTYKEAKPCFGIIKEMPWELDGKSGIKMGMNIWNGFAFMQEDSNYEYLVRIMENPIVITENLLLNELDLRDLDYSIPVYLSKYGAYFAIVSITRDSKGISKCELLKLPEEE
ncbi:MAG: hypothetical protein NC453_21965 [Muribaculum sp.]|nr:hypothetical protein [Muribaculum sp.]